MSTDSVHLIGSRRSVARIQVAPGVRVAAKLAEAAPKFGLVRLQRNADGTLTPMLSTWKTHVTLTKDLGTRLGLDLSYAVLTNLIRAGFVHAKRPAPGKTLVEVESLHRHLIECEDPEFWTPQRIARYRAGEAEG